MSLKREAGKETSQTSADTETKGATDKAPAQGVEAAKNENQQIAALLAELDAERQALVQNTINQLSAGGTVDKGAYRRIKTIDARKNQLIVARFVALLRENGPQVKTIVAQLLEL
jgi:erythromycin esterase-like protein